MSGLFVGHPLDYLPFHVVARPQQHVAHFFDVCQPRDLESTRWWHLYVWVDPSWHRGERAAIVAGGCCGVFSMLARLQCHHPDLGLAGLGAGSCADDVRHATWTGAGGLLLAVHVLVVLCEAGGDRLIIRWGLQWHLNRLRNWLPVVADWLSCGVVLASIDRIPAIPAPNRSKLRPLLRSMELRVRPVVQTGLLLALPGGGGRCLDVRVEHLLCLMLWRTLSE